MTELILPEQPIIADKRKTCRCDNFIVFAQENKNKLNFVIEYASDLFSLSFIENFALFCGQKQLSYKEVDQ